MMIDLYSLFLQNLFHIIESVTLKDVSVMKQILYNKFEITAAF